jgi:hypothetical protein
MTAADQSRKEGHRVVPHGIRDAIPSHSG